MKNTLKLIAIGVVAVFMFAACSKDAATDITNPGSASGADSSATSSSGGSSSSTSTAPSTATTAPSTTTTAPSTTSTAPSTTSTAPSTTSTAPSTTTTTTPPAVTGSSDSSPVDTVEASDGAVLGSAYGTVAEHVAAGRIKNNHGQINKYTKRYGDGKFWMYKYNKNIWKDAKK